MFVFNFLKRYKLFNNFIVSEDQNLQRILFLLLISFLDKTRSFFNIFFSKGNFNEGRSKVFFMIIYIYLYLPSRS